MILGVRFQESESGSPNLGDSGIPMPGVRLWSPNLGVGFWSADSGSSNPRFRIGDSDWDFQSEITKVGFSWIALVGFSLSFDFLRCSSGLLSWTIGLDSFLRLLSKIALALILLLVWGLALG